MPRLARLELPGIPVHVIHRGINRGAVFVDDQDRLHYLDLLARVIDDSAVAVHAYVLMGNHVHLLASADQAGALSGAVGRVSQCYAQAFNRRHGRTGPLWEGRFKSCLVDTERYLMAVYRYIELNPVRARLSDAPQRYRWSSVHANLQLSRDPVVTPHAQFLALGRGPKQRAEAYRSWLMQAVSAEEERHIRTHAVQQRALGSPTFQALVERALGRHARVRPCGRPASAARD